MPERYKVAIIGLGRIGAQLEVDSKREKPCTHLGSWLTHSDRCEVVGVCDSESRRLDDLEGKGYPSLKCFVDYELMLSQVQPDIVSIATPDETHITLARVAMRYERVKLVFLEKPIATTLDDAQKIIDTAREFKVKLAINHTRRWDPLWQAVANLSSEERPGFMWAYFSGDRLRDGVHMADLVNWFAPHDWLVHNFETLPYLLFEVDLFWPNRRLRITSNGLVSKMYLPFDSQHYDGLKELQMTCQTTRSLYPESSMYLATEQLLDALDTENGLKTGTTDPFCTGEQGKRALELALKWQQWGSGFGR